MGYVVNKRRFKQSGPVFLLPYSNKSKVITYLTPDNFKGSDSTTWGDEYSNPMKRDSYYYGTWQLAADGKSVRVNPGYGNEYALTIYTPSNFYNFTIYVVAKYSGGNIFIRPTSPNPQYNTTIFDDTSTSGTKHIGSNFARWHTGNYREFSGTSAYDGFQAYALSYQKNGKPVHVLNSSSAVTFPYNGDNYPYVFKFYSDTSPSGEAYIKFLAIVSEAESSTVLQNNINFIRTQLNIT